MGFYLCYYLFFTSFFSCALELSPLFLKDVIIVLLNLILGGIGVIEAGIQRVYRFIQRDLGQLSTQITIVAIFVGRASGIEITGVLDASWSICIMVKDLGFEKITGVLDAFWSMNLPIEETRIKKN